MGTYNTLVDLMGHRDLGAKTLLFMVDALYAGIVAFLILPAFFIFGLILIPVGALWEHRRAARTHKEPRGAAPYPTIDFNKPEVRLLTGVVAVRYSTISKPVPHFNVVSTESASRVRVLAEAMIRSTTNSML